MICCLTEAAWGMSRLPVYALAVGCFLQTFNIPWDPSVTNKLAIVSFNCSSSAILRVGSVLRNSACLRWDLAYRNWAIYGMGFIVHLKPT